MPFDTSCLERVRRRIRYLLYARGALRALFFFSFGAISALYLWFLRPGWALLCLCLALNLVCFLIWRHGWFRKVTLTEAAQLLDTKLALRDRLSALLSLGGSHEQGARDLLLRQLESQAPVIDERALLPCRFDRELKLYCLALPLLVLGLIATWIHAPRPLATRVRSEISALEQILEQEVLTPEVQQSIENLVQTLESSAANEQELVASALASAQDQIEQALSDLADQAQEQNVVPEFQEGKPATTPSATPSATPTLPQPSPSVQPSAGKSPAPSPQKKDNEQSSKEKDSQSGEQQQEPQSEKGAEKDKGQAGQKGEEKEQGKEQGEGEGKDPKGKGENEGQGDNPSQQGKESSNSSQNEKQDGQQNAKGSKEGKGAQGNEQRDQQSKGSDSQQQQSEQGSPASSGSKQEQAAQQAKQALGEMQKKLEQNSSDKPDPAKQGTDQQGSSGDNSSQPPSKQPPQTKNKPGQGQQSNQKAEQPGKGQDKTEPKSEPEKKQAEPGAAKSSSKSEDQRKDSKPESENKSAGMSSLPKDAQGTREFPSDEGHPSKYKNSAREFEERTIEGDKETVDSSVTEKRGKVALNPEEARPKTALSELKLAKPEVSQEESEQPIPLEYRDILR